MKFILYKMFVQSTHFGNGMLESALSTMPVERLYSALFIEAMKYGVSESFTELSQKEAFVMSDIFLYKEGLFFPKPIGYPKVTKVDASFNRTHVKMLKKIGMIHESQLESYVHCALTEDTLEALYNEQKSLIISSATTQKGIDPYRVGVVRYPDDVQLAFIASESDLLIKLMESLQFTGLGGKKSIGYGQFKLEVEELSAHVRDHVTLDHKGPVMLLNTALPVQEELDTVLTHAHYLLKKSSGFVSSEKFATARRKHDIYKFQAGSTFEQTFKGRIIDVAPIDSPHPVWNYARPLFLKLG